MHAGFLNIKWKGNTFAMQWLIAKPAQQLQVQKGEHASSEGLPCCCEVAPNTSVFTLPCMALVSAHGIMLSAKTRTANM